LQHLFGLVSAAPPHHYATGGRSAYVWNWLAALPHHYTLRCTYHLYHTHARYAPSTFTPHTCWLSLCGVSYVLDVRRLTPRCWRRFALAAGVRVGCGVTDAIPPWTVAICLAQYFTVLAGFMPLDSLLDACMPDTVWTGYARCALRNGRVAVQVRRLPRGAEDAAATSYFAGDWVASSAYFGTRRARGRVKHVPSLLPPAFIFSFSRAPPHSACAFLFAHAVPYLPVYAVFSGAFDLPFHAPYWYRCRGW